MTQDYKKDKQVKQLGLTYFLLMKKLFEAFDFNDDEAFGDDVIDAHKDDGGIAKAQFAGVINMLNDTLSESEYKSIYDSDNERIFIFKKIKVLRRGQSPRGRQFTKHVERWKLFYLIQPDNNVYRLYIIPYSRLGLEFDIDEDINIKNIHVTPKKEVPVNKDVSLLMDAIPTLYITYSSTNNGQELYIKSFEQFEDFIKRIDNINKYSFKIIYKLENNDDISKLNSLIERISERGFRFYLKTSDGIIDAYDTLKLNIKFFDSYFLKNEHDESIWVPEYLNLTITDAIKQLKDNYINLPTDLQIKNGIKYDYSPNNMMRYIMRICIGYLRNKKLSENNEDNFNNLINLIDKNAEYPKFDNLEDNIKAMLVYITSRLTKIDSIN